MLLGGEKKNKRKSLHTGNNQQTRDDRGNNEIEDKVYYLIET